MNRKDLQALSQARLVEAKALLAADLPGGAYYLAGYSVECALKACIAKQTRRYDFPEKRWAEKAYTHDLAKLVTHANLESSRSAEASNDPAFRNHWDLVVQWTEESRYYPKDAAAAKALIEACADRKHGVITWLKRHW